MRSVFLLPGEYKNKIEFEFQISYLKDLKSLAKMLWAKMICFIGRTSGEGAFCPAWLEEVSRNKRESTPPNSGTPPRSSKMSVHDAEKLSLSFIWFLKPQPFLPVHGNFTLSRFLISGFALIRPVQDIKALESWKILGGLVSNSMSRLLASFSIFNQKNPVPAFKEVVTQSPTHQR